MKERKTKKEKRKNLSIFCKVVVLFLNEDEISRRDFLFLFFQEESTEEGKKR
jgi:hypothetical protein|tara:strand:- start:114 stop:269 length:156 start_codon:yes stop_codon:yes gene_type:complete